MKSKANVASTHLWLCKTGEFKQNDSVIPKLWGILWGKCFWHKGTEKNFQCIVTLRFLDKNRERLQKLQSLKVYYIEFNLLHLFKQ